MDAQELADAFRIGIARSGMTLDTRVGEVNFLPLAISLTDYFKTHLEVTLPNGGLIVDGKALPNSAVACKVS